MKILVTGGTGFVGRNFLKHILPKKMEIILLTRNKKNVPDYIGSNVKVFEGDIIDKNILNLIAREEKSFDMIFHLAGSLIYFSDKDEIYKYNVVGTQNLLRLGVKTGIRRFVYASSIEAAGGVRLEEIPASTNRKPNPISSYGWSKVLAEKEVRKSSENNFKAAILRIGNVYGSDNLNFIHVITDAIIKKTRVLEYLPYYYDRFIHPVHNDDVSRGILAASECEKDFVIATLANDYVTILDLFTICSEYMRIPFRNNTQKKLIDLIYLNARKFYHKHQGGGGDFITYLLAPKGKSIHRAYSIDELKNDIGFIPKIKLKDGVIDAIEWAKEIKYLDF